MSKTTKILNYTNTEDDGIGPLRTSSYFAQIHVQQTDRVMGCCFSVSSFILKVLSPVVFSAFLLSVSVFPP